MFSGKGVVQVSCGANHTLALVKGTHLHVHTEISVTLRILKKSLIFFVAKNQNISVHDRVVV